MLLVEIEKSKKGFSSFLKKHGVCITHILKKKEKLSSTITRGYFAIILSRESEVHNFDYFGPMPIRFDGVIDCLLRDADVTEDDIEDLGYDFKEGLKVLRACQETRQKLIALLGSEGLYENFRDEFQEAFPDL